MRANPRGDWQIAHVETLANRYASQSTAQEAEAAMSHYGTIQGLG